MAARLEKVNGTCDYDKICFFEHGILVGPIYAELWKMFVLSAFLPCACVCMQSLLQSQTQPDRKTLTSVAEAQTTLLKRQMCPLLIGALYTSLSDFHPGKKSSWKSKFVSIKPTGLLVV